MRAVALLCVLSTACATIPYGANGDGWTGLPQIDAGGPDVAASDGGGLPPEPTLGATPYAGGTVFRLWAPNAEQVFVAGEWDGFDAAAHPMTRTPGGVFIADVPLAAVGQTYHYLIHYGGQVLTRNDPRAREVTGFSGRSVITDPRAFAWTAAFTPPPFSEQVIYELHLGTFNVRAGAAWGDFAGATEKLDHLRDLGVNMIELMPPTEFRGDRGWGYNPQFPFAAEAAYGRPDDVRRFVDAAHARGIGVIADVVYNHWTSGEQPLKCFDGDCKGKNGIYFYTDAERATTPWGPRPDFGRAEVRDYIRDNALMWLDEYHCDGLRWDSTVNIRAYNDGAAAIPDGWSMLRAINDVIDARFPKTLQIAEDLKADDKLTMKTVAGGAGFDAQWDPAFFWPVNTAILAATDAGRDLNSVRDAILHKHNGDGMQRVVYTESHDEVANGKKRIPEMISPGDAGSLVARKRSTLGAAVVLTAPGVPMLFMGMELLENGSFADQKPIDWSKATTYAGILQLYRDLIALRRNTAGVTRGLTGNNVSAFHVNNTDKVIAYHRWQSGGAGDDVIVLANFSGKAFTNYEIGLPRPGTWKVRLNSDLVKYSSDFGNLQTADAVTIAGVRDGFQQKAGFVLGKYAVVILSQ